MRPDSEILAIHFSGGVYSLHEILRAVRHPGLIVVIVVGQLFGRFLTAS